MELNRLARNRHLHVFALVAALVAMPMAATELVPPTHRAGETANSQTLVHFPDAVLRRAVEERLSKAAGDPITRGELATLASLSVPGDAHGREYFERELREGGVRDLAGIEYAINLRSLSLRGGWISNVVQLAGLASLMSARPRRKRNHGCGTAGGLDVADIDLAAR